MNYLNIIKEDMANGPGIRVTLFTSGCPHHCKGCFSKESWDYNAGKEFTIPTQKYILSLLEKEYITGFSILGGEPLIPQNRYQLACLINKVKETYPEKNIWLWTGYIAEDLYKQAEQDNYLCFILDNIDVLIDGPFIQEEKDITIPYAGSRNQRIIYMK